MANKNKANKNKANKEAEFNPAPAPVDGEQAAPEAETDAGEAAPRDPRLQSQKRPPQAVEKEPAAPSYICVLGVRETEWEGKAGAVYEGAGTADTDEGRARLAHLLKRGAIRLK